MTTARAVVVIGGGPAGLAAAIALARAGRPVTVHEAGGYPRHRVCGEYLSGGAQRSLVRLGLGDLCDRLGATHVTGLRATVASRGRIVADHTRRVPEEARGVSRFDLDQALAAAARGAGVDVRELSRVADANAITDAQVIVATGRQRPPYPGTDGTERDDRRTWMGIKAHVRGVPPSDSLRQGVTAVHFMRGAYVGLVEVACNGERVVNVCALLRRDSLVAGGNDGPLDLFERLASESPAFAAQWRGATADKASVCATAGFDFEIHGGARGNVLQAGDAAALVAPFTGDGQAAALTSGLDASDAVLGAERGVDPATAMTRAFARSDRRRLIVARTLQRVLLTPSLAAPFVHVTGASDRALSWAWQATRSAQQTRQRAAEGAREPS